MSIAPITDRTAALLLALATQQITPTELRQALYVQLATEGTIARGLTHRLLSDPSRYTPQP